MLRVNEVKLTLEEDEESIPLILAKLLKISELDILQWEISKKSIDARNKANIFVVYSLDIELKNEEKLLKNKHIKNIVKLDEEEITYHHSFIN